LNNQTNPPITFIISIAKVITNYKQLIQKINLKIKNNLKSIPQTLTSLLCNKLYQSKTQHLNKINSIQQLNFKFHLALLMQ